MAVVAATPWSAPRWLARWAVATVALLFALLALGAVVTSFRVGMADPVWPTRPWHLAVINWREQDAGYLIEHTHRLAGFVVGGAVTVLAFGLWFTERRSALKWGGATALVALVAAFGQMHGTLIEQQRIYNDALAPPAIADVPPAPNWALAVGPTLAALALFAAILLVVSRSGSAGRGVRILGAVLLLAVMIQGLLGGLRVYLNALVGTDLAAAHGVFSQVVVALAIGVLVATRPIKADRWAPTPGVIRAAVLTAAAIFGQIIAGAVLRHSTSPLGPRLHLLLAFAVLAAVVIVGRQLAGAPPAILRFKVALHSLVGLQLLLGIEAWLSRFASGFAVAPLQRITEADAAIRTAHALVGYALFAVVVGLAFVLLRSRPAATLFRSALRIPHNGAVEVVV